MFRLNLHYPRHRRNYGLRAPPGRKLKPSRRLQELIEDVIVIGVTVSLLCAVLVLLWLL